MCGNKALSHLHKHRSELNPKKDLNTNLKRTTDTKVLVHTKAKLKIPCSAESTNCAIHPEKRQTKRISNVKSQTSLAHLPNVNANLERA